MGFNFGAFVGGVGTGYAVEKEMERKDAEAARKQKEQDRLDAEARYEESVNKQVAGYMTNRLLVNDPRANDPLTHDQAKPQYRQPDINDMVDVANYRTALYLKGGKYSKAIDAHNDYKAFAAEKLKTEEDQRTDLAKKAAAGVLNGDYSGLQPFYAKLPDGRRVDSVTPNDDGSIDVVVARADGVTMPPVKFKNREYLANTILSYADTKAALAGLDSQWKREFDEQKQRDDAQHKNKETAINQQKADNEARHHHVMEGIERTKADAERIKADKSKEPTTPEITNMQYLVKAGIAKDEKEAWEMVRTGKTRTGDEIHMDGWGGFVIKKQDGTIISNDGKGEEKIVHTNGAAPAKPQAPASPAATKGISNAAAGKPSTPTQAPSTPKKTIDWSKYKY